MTDDNPWRTIDTAPKHGPREDCLEGTLIKGPVIMGWFPHVGMPWLIQWIAIEGGESCWKSWRSELLGHEHGRAYMKLYIEPSHWKWPPKGPQLH